MDRTQDSRYMEHVSRVQYEAWAEQRSLRRYRRATRFFFGACVFMFVALGVTFCAWLEMGEAYERMRVAYEWQRDANTTEHRLHYQWESSARLCWGSK